MLVLLLEGPVMAPQSTVNTHTRAHMLRSSCAVGPNGVGPARTRNPPPAHHFTTLMSPT